MESANSGRLTFMKGFNFFILGICVGLVSCANPNSNSEETSERSHKLEVKYARGFEISKDSAGFYIRVRNPQDTLTILAEYHLNHKSHNDGIHIPATSAALNSTTFVAYFDWVGSIDLVKGISYIGSVKNQNMLALIQAGQSVEITEGNTVSYEKLVAIGPEVYMTYDIDDENMERLESAGIHVIQNVEYLESHPLGRAEWIKVIGALTGNLEQAIEVFERIESEYNELRVKAALSSYMPSVFTGSKYGDIWYAPGSQSYISQYIAHAGANYLFSKSEGGSLEIDYEVALEAVSKSDFLGLVVSEDPDYSLRHFIKQNPDFEQFQVVKDKRIFVCNSSEADYFGDAVMEPQVVLADLISIFHPTYLPDHETKYFHLLD
jgi:iron complex transport system substrate-binding protein